MMARERNGSGYIALLNMHGHPHADSRGRVLEHIHLASAALGRPLPKGAEIHHVNEITDDNTPGNLVLCPDRAYHKLLHSRMRALAGCGNANYRPCQICRKWEPIDAMVIHRKTGALVYAHKECKRAALKAWRHTGSTLAVRAGART
jgi:hypothetical protein